MEPPGANGYTLSATASTTNGTTSRRHRHGDAALPREVRGQERQDEQADVAHQRCAVVDPGDAGLDRDARPDRECEHDRELAPPRRAGVVGVLRNEDELLPQPVGVLAGELAGDGVEVAEALDRDEEGLLVIEAGRVPVGDLLAQVVLELVDVGRGDRLATLHVSAPPVDLGLQLSVVRHHAHPSTAAAGPRRGLPDLPQRVCDDGPLLLPVGECLPARRRDRVVLAPAPGVGRTPRRRDVAEPLESVQQRVEHPVRPLHATARELTHALEDRVAVQVARPTGSPARAGSPRRRPGLCRCARRLLYLDAEGYQT